ncbi:NAD(P)/FAD-dependent oxidoreductase [Leucobacter sp. NPDC058333]|uniref:NAD(P)/FAD-dependent oxidoreductase n=1 Tax=Leucobacter sp. NPDC058333 TaxID=3346450 RepID=UPI003655A5F7
MTYTHWDAIVIGGGAAGLSAAQALGRSLRRTLVIDGGLPRNRFASHMHNVLGLDGTPPLELVARGRAEAEAYGVEFRTGAVRTVRDGTADTHETTSAGSPAPDRATAPSGFVSIELDSGETLLTRAVVVATGVTDELPEIPGLAERWGASVLHCPYCHGWEVRGQRLAVVTTSPIGLHQAKLLGQWSDNLTVFTAGLVDDAGVSALDAVTERGLLARGVHLVAAPVTEVAGDGAQVTAVRTADGQEYPVDAVFTGFSMVPHDSFLRDLALDRSETPMGAFISVDPMQRTSHPRIWAAGNVVSPAASVPMVMGAGTLAGAAVNAALVEEDIALAAAERAGI